jgi:hypothetical protein
MTIGEHFTPDGSPDGTALEAFPDNSGGEHARGRWRPAARSLGYRVTIRLTGSPRPVSVITGKRSLSFTVTSSRVGVTATVQGEGGFGVLGRAASARLRAGRRGGPAHHRRSKHHRRK